MSITQVTFIELKTILVSPNEPYELLLTELFTIYLTPKQLKSITDPALLLQALIDQLNRSQLYSFAKALHTLRNARNLTVHNASIEHCHERLTYNKLHKYISAADIIHQHCEKLNDTYVCQLSQQLVDRLNTLE